MKKSLSIAALLGVAGALVFGGAPAFAADAPTLPPGQTLYNIDCDTAGGQLWSFTTDGASTPIGSGANSGDCAGGAQTSPVDGKTYLIFYPPGQTKLATVDLTTGVVTPIADINGATTGAWQFVITNSGAAFLSNSSTLYRVDLLTGTTTAVGSIAPFSPGAMAYDSLTDTIYGFDFGNTLKIYTINPATGAATDTGHGGNWPVALCLEGGSTPGSPNSAVFDSNGIAWLQSDSCTSNIMAWDPVGNVAWMAGELFDSTATLYPSAPNVYYSETFFISPLAAAKPALASTGNNLGALSLVGITAAMAALLGVVLLTSRRQRNA